ncbi:MAG: ribonuclease HI [Clostridia bacterium]|nr:ribonuclease HI [Clostridia bacterium]
MNKILIYTDGACSHNPGPGGWAAILIYKNYIKEISGGNPNTTNNRMELTAAVKALELIKRPSDIILYSDSAYLINAFTRKWVDRWVKNGWKTSTKKSVENKDLWELLIKYDRTHNIEWVKVKGHSDNEMNNRCDQLAKEQIKK